MLPLLLAFISAIPPYATTPDQCWLRDAASTHGGAVFLLCEQGVLFKSKGLSEWESIQIPAPDGLRAIHFLDESRGVVVGDSGLVMITSDGGRTWEKRPSGTREHLTTVYGAGSEVWAGGYGGVILHSDDAGLTWKSQQTFTSAAVESLYFLDEYHGWAAGWHGLLLRTSDGGNSWQQVTVPGLWEALSAIRFRDPQCGCAVGMYGLLLCTRDGGTTWLRQPIGTRSWLTSLDFGPDGTAWIAAEYQVLRSEDCGETWQVLPHDSATAVTRVLATQQSVLAVGPAFLLTRPRNESSWLRTNLDEIVQSAGLRPREEKAMQISGGPS